MIVCRLCKTLNMHKMFSFISAKNHRFDTSLTGCIHLNKFLILLWKGKVYWNIHSMRVYAHDFVCSCYTCYYVLRRRRAKQLGRLKQISQFAALKKCFPFFKGWWLEQKLKKVLCLTSEKTLANLNNCCRIRRPFSPIRRPRSVPPEAVALHAAVLRHLYMEIFFESPTHMYSLWSLHEFFKNF